MPLFSSGLCGLLLLLSLSYQCGKSNATINWGKSHHQETLRKMLVTGTSSILSNIRNIKGGSMMKEDNNHSNDRTSDSNDNNNGGSTLSKDTIGLSGYRSHYDDRSSTQSNSQLLLPQQSLLDHFKFRRFQSPSSISGIFNNVRNPMKSFKWFADKDRKGYYSSAKLGNNWVLAESKQTAVNCTTKEVLAAYLSGELQTKWNGGRVLKCTFTKCKKNDGHNEDDKRSATIPKGHHADRGRFRFGDKSLRSNNKDGGTDTGYFYCQDLHLKSQRVIRGHTGVMKYQQIIEIDQVGDENYSILVRLLQKNPKKAYLPTHHDESRRNPISADVDDDVDPPTMVTTAKKPFESLNVYVSLQQNQNNVDIYAAGVFEVNRQVVPKVLVFDASGIAADLAGKGTLWLASYFEKRAAKEARSNK